MANRISVIVFMAVLFTFFACSEEEQKLEVYNPEAFAFNIGTEWELNASAQVKGFTQVEDGKEYSTKLSYYVNLITPSNETLEEIDYGLINRTSPEKLMDTQLEIQIVFDSTFSTGDYTLQIFVLDDLSEQKDSTQVKFSLTN